jgi:type VI secretion system protein ImpK
VQTLLDLLQEGFYLLFMLKNGSTPPGETEFLDTVTAYLAEFDREARKLRAQGEDIDAAKYAFCAALDEIILSSQFPMRFAWERRPLQLVIFGDQLAASTSSTGWKRCAASAARGCRRCRCSICAC